MDEIRQVSDIEREPLLFRQSIVQIAFHLVHLLLSDPSHNVGQW